jgi:hypothetical protein
LYFALHVCFAPFGLLAPESAEKIIPPNNTFSVTEEASDLYLVEFSEK